MKQSPADKIGLYVVGRLAEIRQKKGVTFEELGGRTGLHPTSLSLIERGKRQPSFTNLVRIASALDVRLSRIAREAEDSLRRP